MKEQQDFAAVVNVLEKARSFGYKRLENGTQLFGHVPHVAPEAWLHAWFAGLSEEQLETVSQVIGRPLPQELALFYAQANGVNLFANSLAVFGLRSNYHRTLTDVWQPFDIGTINALERPRDADSSFVFFGSYNWDGSLLYFDPRSNRVVRCTRDSAKALNSWDSLGKMLAAEANRLLSHFDETGCEINPLEPTTPSAQA